MSTICEEVFDEISHPSEEEIKDYATKIGIDPDSEPQLLPLAAEGLMKALPPGWKPCYDDKSKSYYYYNNTTKKTQWEHPLDEVYRGLVKKARAESQSASIHDNRDDATFVTDDLLSLDEPPRLSDPFPIGTKRKDVRLSPLKLSPAASPKKESRLFKQMSEDINIKSAKKLSLGFSSFDNDKDISFDKHPRSMDKPELKLTGGGSMFLKSNTKKSTLLEQQSSLVVTSNMGKSDSFQESQQPKSILREKLAMEHSKSVEFDKLSTLDKSDKEDDERKSVRFNLDTNTDIDKSSSEDELSSNKNMKADEIINVKVTPNKSRFTVVPVSEPSNSLKLIKPNPSDFVKPKLTLNKGSDSDEETRSLEKIAINNMDSLFDSDNSTSSHEDKLGPATHSKLVNKSDKAVEKMKQKIWEEKNDELVKFKDGLESSHKNEIDRIVDSEKSKYEETLKTELDDLRKTIKEKHKIVLEKDEKKLDADLVKLKAELEAKFEMKEKQMREEFENKKDELEKYYEEKLAEVEKELADKVDRSKSELMFTHNANLDQLKQNHSILIDDLKRGFKTEEQLLKKEHQAQMSELRARNQNEVELEKNKCDEKAYEKLRCEKRLLEEKYRCLKDKYLRLKTDVKLSIEKRNKKKEQSITTNTTGSETEQSNSNNKDRKLIDKPPTPKQNRSGVDAAQHKSEGRNLKQVIIQDLDTSISDNCYQSDDKANQNDSSDSTNPGRNKRKLFSRLKSSSTSRINNNAKSKKPQRACSPVENLRKQLQKLEDLEDQFPNNSQSDTYHLRYPFSDGHKFEGSSELEFFRHRIHLERDSIKRAKESLRSQKTLFQQRQKELKLKHGSMARHTLQQLCQEEKELTDMEVNLHRTRSLLGEKVIRLRHLEQSLQRANLKSDQKCEDATLSDLSSHSASSGISSTEFAAGEFARGSEKYQESSEIMQSLENLNSEIREIWDVLRTQQQQNNLAKVTTIPPLAMYPDLGWPMLAATSSSSAAVTAPHSIPTLADRLHTYRQQVAMLANAQSTIVTAAGAGGEQAITTHLVERTRNLKHWLRQTTAAATVGEAATSQEASHSKPPQATL